MTYSYFTQWPSDHQMMHFGFANRLDLTTPKKISEMKQNWQFSFISKLKCCWAHAVNFLFNKKERKKKKRIFFFLFNKLELNAAKRCIILNDNTCIAFEYGSI